jgi:hypothetical protein
MSDSAGALAERSDHELDDCGGDTLGETGELSLCRRSDT